jgi:preprotein translocase subunit SecD
MVYRNKSIMAKLKITGKIWFLIIIVILSFLSIFVTFNPFGITFLQKGVIVSYVENSSQIAEDGLMQGMIIYSINNKEIRDLEDYQKEMNLYKELEENVTKRLEIQTNTIKIIGIYDSTVTEQIRVKNIDKTKLKTGLDLQGGSRAFIKINAEVTSREIDDLISILEQRLNVYGLSDINIYKVTTSGDESLIGVEIAGSSPEELDRLIGEQGHFVAKIANQTVFVGGDKDITHVGRTGTDALVSECRTSNGEEICSFRFVISISTRAADKFAEITKDLETEENCIPRYDPNCYLAEKIEFYIDGVLTSSLNIGADLKGNPTTTIQISGSGSGSTRQDAIDNTKKEMKTLQTILITGSLPYDLEIVKIDRISPNLGNRFIPQILYAGLFAIIAVIIIIFIRYRNIKISGAVIIVSLSEVLIILGVAALINWNLDLPSIAGIIAAIGTGIDSQIIVLDESRDKNQSLRDRIKKALFIITTAFATTLVALLPLTGFLGFLGIGAASAGMLKGFAITTLIGISVGVFISRPAFADIVRQLSE